MTVESRPMRIQSVLHQDSSADNRIICVKCTGKPSVEGLSAEVFVQSPDRFRYLVLAISRLTQVPYVQRVTALALKSWGTLMGSRWWVTIQE